jgi:MFS transporter, FSR family, fosmidomycin resistance protein
MTTVSQESGFDSEDHFSRSEERAAFGVTLGAHALHDGYTSLINVMMPIWQAEFGLSYVSIGLLRAVVHGTLAIFQIPAGRLAERFGAAVVLAAGTLLAGICFCLAGASAGFGSLLVVLFMVGLGSSVQHPIASALIARVFGGTRSMSALGTYNFAGDVGKMLLPASTTLLIAVMPWRPALAILGSLGVVGAIMIFLLTPRFTRKPGGQSASNRSRDKNIGVRGGRAGFPILFSIAVIDSATSTSLFMLLPFLLTSKGASLQSVGFAYTLLFAGGAAGKLVFAFMGARIGAIATVCLSESMTALGILVLLALPLGLDFIALPIMGVVLNGTSSVLYGSVPQYVEPEKRSRAFGVFYTGTIGAGALAPIMYGLVSDTLGVPATLAVVAAVVLLTLPLAAALRATQIAR